MSSGISWENRQLLDSMYSFFIFGNNDLRRNSFISELIAEDMK